KDRVVADVAGARGGHHVGPIGFGVGVQLAIRRHPFGSHPNHLTDAPHAVCPLTSPDKTFARCRPSPLPARLKRAAARCPRASSERLAHTSRPAILPASCCPTAAAPRRIAAPGTPPPAAWPLD